MKLKTYHWVSAGVLAAVFLLSACGQKGPLYLPTPPAAPSKGASQ